MSIICFKLIFINEAEGQWAAELQCSLVDTQFFFVLLVHFVMQLDRIEMYKSISTALVRCLMRI